ncbi:MAG: hypothetical protein ABUS79_05725 [Pseudomonadota bacterium]
MHLIARGNEQRNVPAGYALTVNEGATPRTYNVWRRAVPASGTNVALPNLISTGAPFYLVIVE